MEEQLAGSQGLLYFSPLLAAAGALKFLKGFPGVPQQSLLTFLVDLEDPEAGSMKCCTN